jgi:putative phage-type endonuclease
VNDPNEGIEPMDAAQFYGEPDPTPYVTAFHAHAEFTGVRANDRDAWLAMRGTMLTASDVAAILGEDEHRSALDVYVDKVTPRKGKEILGLDDPRFWGNVLEQPVLRAVADFYGWQYRAGGCLLRSRKHPFLGATLDAEIDRNDGIGWIDFEGKTTRIPRGWDEESGDLPTRVLIQVQAQLLVTGAPCALVFALLQGSRPVRIPVEPDADFHALMVEEGERFMEAVRSLAPPDPDGKPGARKALDRLYPHEDGSTVDLPEEALVWTREYQAVSANMRALERRKEQLAQQLKSRIGAATYGLLPEPVGGKSCWRWETEKRDAYTVEASESRKLLALKEPPESGARRLSGPANDTFMQSLEASVREPAEKIRFGKPRRTR